MINISQYGELVRKFRKSRKLSQSKFASMLGWVSLDKKVNISRVSRIENGTQHDILEHLTTIERIFDLGEDFFKNEVKNLEMSKSNLDLLKICFSHCIQAAPLIKLIADQSYRNALLSSYLSGDSTPHYYNIGNKINDLSEMEELKFNSNSQSRMYPAETLLNQLKRGEIDLLFTYENNDAFITEVANIVTGFEGTVKPLVILNKYAHRKILMNILKKQNIKKDKFSAENKTIEEQIAEIDFSKISYQFSDFTDVLIESNKANDKLVVLHETEHLSYKFIQHYINKKTVSSEIYDKKVGESEKFKIQSIAAGNLEEICTNILGAFNQISSKNFSKKIKRLETHDEKVRLVKDTILKEFNDSSDESIKIVFLFHLQPHLHWLEKILREYNIKNTELGAKIIEGASLFPNITAPIVRFNLYMNSKDTDKIGQIAEFLDVIQNATDNVNTLIKSIDIENDITINGELKILSDYLAIDYLDFIKTVSKLDFKFLYSPNWVNHKIRLYRDV